MRDVNNDDGYQGDFYEDDEPLEKVKRDFAKGHGCLTGDSIRGHVCGAILTIVNGTEIQVRDWRNCAPRMTGWR